MSLLYFSFAITILFLAVILHECAHGWAAYKLGDSTAKNLGRLTLNPIKHVDMVGTLLLPAMLLIMHSPVMFGWAKPVPVNFLNLRHPKQDMIWVGLAGPAVNVFLALLASLFIRFHFSPLGDQILAMAIQINLVLAIFNLVPIPPLDGSRLVMGILPNRYAYVYSRMEPYGIVIVFLLLYLGLFEKYIWPIIDNISLLLGVR